MNQVSFPAFAAAQAAALCPPAGAAQVVNDAPLLVTQPDASGQRVDTLTHAQRRESRRDACHLALARRYGSVSPRFVLLQNTLKGPVALRFIVRPDGPIESLGCVSESLHRIRGAV